MFDYDNGSLTGDQVLDAMAFWDSVEEEKKQETNEEQQKSFWG